MPDPNVRSRCVAVARSERLLKRGTGTAESVAVARRDLAEAKLADYIARVVDSAPPLTAEQRDRLALLLRPAS